MGIDDLIGKQTKALGKNYLNEEEESSSLKKVHTTVTFNPEIKDLMVSVGRRLGKKNNQLIELALKKLILEIGTEDEIKKLKKADPFIR